MKFISVYTEMNSTSDTPLLETKLSDIVSQWGQWLAMFDDSGNVKSDNVSQKQHDNLMRADITSGVAGGDIKKDVPYHEEDLEKIKAYMIGKIKEIAAREKRSPTKADVALIDAVLSRIKKSGPAPVAKPQIDPSQVTVAPGSKYQGGTGYKTDYVMKNGQLMTAKNAANS